MDPQITFQQFCNAVNSGDYETAGDCQRHYNQWVASGGFKATDNDGAVVHKLDQEQDRYLVTDPYGVQRWRIVKDD